MCEHDGFRRRVVCTFEHGQRVAVAAELGERHRFAEAGLGLAGVVGQHAPVLREGIGRPCRATQARGEAQARFHVGRPDRDRGGEPANGVRVPAILLIEHTKAVEREELLGRQAHGLQERLTRGGRRSC